MTEQAFRSVSFVSIGRSSHFVYNTSTSMDPSNDPLAIVANTHGVRSDNCHRRMGVFLHRLYMLFFCGHHLRDSACTVPKFTGRVIGKGDHGHVRLNQWRGCRDMTGSVCVTWFRSGIINSMSLL